MVRSIIFPRPKRRAEFHRRGRPDGAELTAIQAHRVIAWEEVSEGEGTGIVHIAPGCGAEDHALGHEHSACPPLPRWRKSGNYLDGFGEWSGMRSVHERWPMI